MRHTHKRPGNFQHLLVFLFVLILTPAIPDLLSAKQPAIPDLSEIKLRLQTLYTSSSYQKFARLAQAFLLVHEDSDIRSKLSDYHLRQGETRKALSLIKSSKHGLPGKLWVLVRIKLPFWIILISGLLIYLVIAKYASVTGNHHTSDR